MESTSTGAAIYTASSLGIKRIAALRRVLMIDSGSDGQRKERIAVLKSLGFSVYPARDLKQAQSRCKPGRFDLVVVAGADHGDLAFQFCEAIRSRDSRQLLLLLAASEATFPPRDYIIPDTPEGIGRAVAALFETREETSEAA